jgi:hypothetical protein
MKHSQKIAFSLAFVAAAGIVGYLINWSKTKRMLNRIADEGYETAHDILFPGKIVQAKNLHYGPVITGYKTIQ